MNDIHAYKRIRESYKLTGLRKIIGERMGDSLRKYPQGSGSTYLCTESLIDLRKELTKRNENVTLTSILAKLTVEALKEHPLLNSALIENEEFFIYDSINIGVGIGLDDGIMTVVIKEAQDMDIFEISDSLQYLITRLKTKKLQMSDVAGSTFTLSNMGMLGVEQITPFLNPPETGILAVGATKKQVVVLEDDSTAVKPMTCFSITINHAAVDGLHGGRFLLTMKKNVENAKDYMGL
jgi:pyruvate dehydrogenase E2 component (dihydrolipoamide acetyltransferase)